MASSDALSQMPGAECGAVTPPHAWGCSGSIGRMMSRDLGATKTVAICDSHSLPRNSRSEVAQ